MASLGKKCFWSELRVVIEMTEGRKVEAGARRLGAGRKKKSKEGRCCQVLGQVVFARWNIRHRTGVGKEKKTRMLALSSH